MSRPRPIIPPELEEEMTPAVNSFVLVLLERIEELESKVEELTKKDPKRNPNNSSLPPSSQHPHAKPKTRRNKANQKQRGAQPGHPKHSRDLIASDQCDEVIVLKPRYCRKCGKDLIGEDFDRLRHQVWDLP